VALRAQEINRGAHLYRLPTPQELDLPMAERHGRLDDLRVELYAVSSILADAVVGRARQQRPAFPPYGLVLSRYTELRMIVADPGPVAAGAIDGFHALGKAYIDTTVFHLHGSFAEVRADGKGWLLDRLDALLSVFRAGATPATVARMRNGLSFVYGGLQFGTGVSVQLAEVMAGVLGADATLSPADKAAIMTRSSLPAYDLAAFGLAEVPRAYQRLQSPSRRTTSGTALQGWMDPDRFVLREADGRPWRIDLRDEDLLAGQPAAGSLEGLDGYTTLGCPARISPTGATSPIASLWSWCVELAHDTGLLGQVAANGGDEP